MRISSFPTFGLWLGLVMPFLLMGFGSNGLVAQERPNIVFFFSDDFDLIAELALEGPGDVLPVQSHLVRCPIEGGVKVPGANIVLILDFLEYLGGQAVIRLGRWLAR